MIRRLAVIADIHGNYRALEAVLDDISRQQVDAVVSLGDNIGYGPEPREVVETLIDKDIFSVMGNHELALFDSAYYRKLNPTCRESLDLTRSLLSNQQLRRLGELDTLLVRHRARFVHGCPPDSMTAYLFNPTPTRLAAIFSRYPEPLCFAGHTHTIEVFVRHAHGTVGRLPVPAGILKLEPGCRHLIIPGSVGQPRDEVDRKAKYGIWDLVSQTFEFRAVPYDVAATVQLLLKRGFPAVNATRLQ